MRKTKTLSVALAMFLGAASLQATNAVTYKDALNIAAENFPGSVIKDIKIDSERGKLFYELESFKDGVEKEIKIDAQTGKIVKEKTDRGENKNLYQAIDFSKFALSIDDAKDKALGLEAGWTLDSAELDHKNGVWVYEVELDRGMSEKKVVINATNGEIIGNYTK